VARGGQRDSREIFFINSLRFRNLGDTPQAPQFGTLDLYFREKVLFRLEDNGVETPIGGFGASASPGFTWGRVKKVSLPTPSIIPANSEEGEYLLNDGVPSNRSGRLVPFNRPTIRRILLVAEENIVTNPAVFTVQEHNGVTFTDLTSVSLPVGQLTATHTLNVAITSGRQLAVKLVSGECKNPVIGIILDGLY